TIPPANPAIPQKVPPERNQWVSQEDVLIRALAREQGAALADIEAAFLSVAGSNLSQLFSDHIHPNDRGYGIIAGAFFAGISQAGGTAGTAVNPTEPLSRDLGRGPSPGPHAHAPRGR